MKIKILFSVPITRTGYKCLLKLNQAIVKYSEFTPEYEIINEAMHKLAALFCEQNFRVMPLGRDFYFGKRNDGRFTLDVHIKHAD